MWGIYLQSNNSSIQNIRISGSLRRILFYASISAGLCLVSILLNVYAIGARLQLRAFNHINLICFLFIGFALNEIALFGLYKKLIPFGLPLSLVFVIFCNTYSSFKSVPELRAYKESVNARIEKLEQLNANGYKGTFKLEPLDVAEYHSADDLWKFVDPKFVPGVLLRPNDVSKRVNNFYNTTYRKYYKLDFDVITDLSYD